MAKNYFNRYVWLLDTIHRYGHITIHEINRAWRRSYLNENGSDIPERTFFNHLRAIQETFGVIIRHDRSLGYYIDNTGELKSDRLRLWMLQSLSLNNIISESTSLIDRIIFESLTTNNKWLFDIVKSMKDMKIIRILLEKDGLHELGPYCIKQFNKKWYVVGKTDTERELQVFDLDEIVELTYCEETYEMPENFSAEEYFNDYFGVTRIWNLSPETIEIKFSAADAHNLRKSSIHRSQKEIEKSETYSIFQFRLIPNPEFKREILSYGCKAEILSPKWLRKQITDEVLKMMMNYELFLQT